MKKVISLILTLAIIFTVFSFDWPKDNVTENSYSSYFGQKRGNLASTSLIFSDAGDIKAAEDGRVLIVMEDDNYDSDFFPTTLGTSVIIAHEDNLLSVYGNIDSESLAINSITSENVESGQFLGKSGNTGWQTENTNLEFQIVDTNNNTAVNPKILMPRSEKELPLSLEGIFLQNKAGTYFDAKKTKSYSAGLYRFYQKRNKIISPYKTTLAVNGITVDQITYDTISHENGKSCLTGKKKYTSSDIYPNDDLQLIGEVTLGPGKATITIYNEDILSNMKQTEFNITIY